MKNKLIIFGISVFLFSCSGGKQVDELQETANDSASIFLTNAQIEGGEITWGKLENHLFDGEIKTTGSLEVHPSDKAAIHAFLGGFVRELYVHEGQYVSKGSSIFRVEHPDFIQLQQEYLEASAALTYLQSDYERQKQLANEQATSTKNYLKAEAEFKSLKAKKNGLKERLTLIGFSISTVESGQISASVLIKSPISGYVSAVHVSRGSYIDPLDLAVEVVGTENVHVALDVFEKNIAAIQPNQRVTFRLPDFGNSVFEGKVLLVGKTISGEKRVIPVLASIVSSDKSDLIPGMFVDATIYMSQKKALALPENAIVKQGAKKFILIQTEVSAKGKSVVKKEVKTGETKHGFTEVLNASELDADLICITNGAFGIMPND